MNIVVCIKQVPDTASKITLKDGQVSKEGMTFIMSPYDEFALEEALKIKEGLGAGSVTAVTLGPDSAEEVLRSALAMGADQAIHIKDDAFAAADSLGVGRALAAAIKPLNPDLVFCGMKAVDSDAAQVGGVLAELLDLPQALAVTKVEVGDGKLTVNREIEGGSEVLEVQLPCLLTAQKGLNEPRYPSFAGIMKAKKKPLEVKSAADLGLGGDDWGGGAQITEVFLPPPRQAGKVLEGEPADAVKELVRLLREEAKVL